MQYALNKEKNNINIRSWNRDIRNDQLFAYATGRISILETKLLKHEELTLFSDRLTNLTILNDILDRADYPLARTLEERFNLEEKKIDKELKEMASRSLLPRVLLLEKDYHNAKWMLKKLLLSAQTISSNSSSNDVKINNNEYNSADDFIFPNKSGADEHAVREAKLSIDSYIKKESLNSNLDTKTFNTEELLTAAEIFKDEDDGNLSNSLADKLLDGFIPHRILWENILAVMSGKFLVNSCDKYLVDGIVRTLKAYIVWRDLSLVDIILDKVYFEELISLATEDSSGSEKDFILDFASLKSDIANFQSLLRSSKVDTGKSYLRQVLVPGGSAEIKNIVAVYDDAKSIFNSDEANSSIEQNFSNIKKVFANSLAYSLLKHLSGYRTVDQIRELGRDSDNLTIDLARKGRQSSYGAERVAGYWIAKQMEVKNIRIMHACREVDLSYDDTVKLLRKEYHSL